MKDDRSYYIDLRRRGSLLNTATFIWCRAQKSRLIEWKKTSFVCWLCSPTDSKKWDVSKRCTACIFVDKNISHSDIFRDIFSGLIEQNRWPTVEFRRSVMSIHLFWVLYGAFYILCISKRSGMDHTVLPVNTPCLFFLRKRSPDGATPNRGKRHPITAYYSYLSTPKGWKAELAWLVDL